MDKVIAQIKDAIATMENDFDEKKKAAETEKAAILAKKPTNMKVFKYYGTADNLEAAI